MLSRYRYLICGKPPRPVAISNVEQHSWLGYYAILAPGPTKRADSGSGEMEEISEQTIEMRVSRTVGLGVHEDIDFTNFTQAQCSLQFEIDLDADFADQAETRRQRQKGTLTRRWRKVNRKRSELNFEYRAHHGYSHQGNRGVVTIHRGLSICIDDADSKPEYRDGKVKFEIKLAPHGSW